MTGTRPSLLVAACDDYLAGAFARRFTREGWEVVTVASVKDAEHTAVQMRPSVLFLHTACVADPAAEVRRLRALPTMRSTRVVVLADRAHMPAVNAALAAGAADYLLVGHVIPAEAVEKMKRLLHA